MVIDFFETFAEIGHNSFFLCLLRFLIASIIVGVRDYRSTLSKITDQFDKTLLIHWSNAFTYLITFYL